MKEQHRLFIGSYSEADRPGIHAFDYEGESGELTMLSSFAGIRNPSFLTIHPDGRWLYAVSETGQADGGNPGAVWAFAIDPQSARLEPINSLSTNGDWPCHLSIDAGGRWIIASNYGTGDVAVFSILDHGGLGEMTDFAKHEGSGPNIIRQEGPHAHSATMSPDNRFAIVADLGIDSLVIYALDRERGTLQARSTTHTHPGAGPRHAAFSLDGERLYVANELNCTVTTYAYDREQGGLTELQTLETLPADAPENIVADIHVSPTGEQVYVSNRGHNSLAVFGVRPDGLLERTAVVSCGGSWPRNFAPAPDARYILVANERSDEISVLPTQPDVLEAVEPVSRTPVTRPTCIAFLP